MLYNKYTITNNISNIKFILNNYNNPIVDLIE